MERDVSGVIAAALTPLQADYRPAYQDFPLLLDFLAKRGCHGVLLLGTTGEGPSFSPEERAQILQAGLAVRQVHPEFRLLVGTGTPSLEETILINRAAFDLGVDGVVILPPYYFRNVSEAGLFNWFSEVVRRSVPPGGTFLYYHIPPVTGISISMDFLEKLMEAFPDRRMGIKDSTTDPDFARQIGLRFGRNLLTFNGTDSLFDLALEHQASGCITAMANLRSPDLRQVWDARMAGAVDISARQRLEEYRIIMNQYPPNPSLYKALLPRLYGLPEWSVRPPLTPLSEKQIQAVLAELSLQDSEGGGNNRSE